MVVPLEFVLTLEDFWCSGDIADNQCAIEQRFSQHRPRRTYCSCGKTRLWNTPTRENINMVTWSSLESILDPLMGARKNRDIFAIVATLIFSE